MDRMAVAVGALTCIRSDPVEPVDLKSPCRERSTKRTCTFTFTTDTRFNSTPHEGVVGCPVERGIKNLISQINHLYLNILTTVRRLLKILQMMSEGNTNVSEHFRKHFKSTEDFRSCPSMPEVHPKMFRLYKSCYQT